MSVVIVRIVWTSHMLIDDIDRAEASGGEVRVLTTTPDEYAWSPIPMGVLGRRDQYCYIADEMNLAVRRWRESRG